MGDNGIVSVMILTPADGEPGVLELVNWVMSCRVFGRQLEDEAMNILVEAARERGARALRARFTPTEKNAVVKDLFGRLGFSLEETTRGVEPVVAAAGGLCGAADPDRPSGACE